MVLKSTSRRRSRADKATFVSAPDPRLAPSMGRLEDRLLDHPVRERIAALRSASGALDKDAKRAVDDQHQGVVDRIPKVLDFVEGALATADPALATEASLAGIDSHLGQAADTITQLPSDPAQALALDQQLEAVIGAAVPLLLATPLLVDRAEHASEAFDTALSGSVKQLNADATQLAAELDALEQRRLGADETITEEDEGRRQALLEQAEALKSAVATEQQRLDQLVPTFEQQFSEAQDARQATFDEARASLEASAESVRNDLAHQADETKRALSDEANAVLAEVKARRDEVNDLYRVVTRIGRRQRVRAVPGSGRGETLAAQEPFDRQEIGSSLYAAVELHDVCVEMGLHLQASLDLSASSRVPTLIRSGPEPNWESGTPHHRALLEALHGGRLGWAKPRLQMES